MSDIDDVAFINAGRIASQKPVFDESTHTWTLASRQGEPQRARVLIATDGVPDGRDPEALRPYLGVAIHGLPNYFLITGPDVAAQKSYIAKCLQVMADTGSTRIEVRYSTQRYFNEKMRPGKIQWRRVGKHIRRAFDLTSQVTVADDLYDGRATVHIGEDGCESRVRLTGHFDPIDGQYHWQGMILEELAGTDRLPKPAVVTIGNRSSAARITERTPQGGYSVVGVGAPPFALEETVVR
ncbi:hypothetical protein Mycsm_05303 [Mycobacterium sp. JS623]|uniref:DUF4873 domain-containing protein n=1 Tax=Mycobacterium sp. JS623 TaxID=212767 RepID=UPI0002A5A282|nr:DUF4873 domain-containing protein [Mycobacterium sp. JS623]AGB25501.1 hypothetical protein Mycsm_05303 [Mycobacterium sp. JS623]